MVVGSLKARLLVRESYTLKDKRQVVRSIKDRLRAAFNVSAAEVDDLEDRQLFTLGFAAVANEAQAVRSQLDEIVKALRSHPKAEFVKAEIEVLNFEGGGDYR